MKSQSFPTSSGSNAAIGALAADFIKMPISQRDTLIHLRRKFHNIMRKHGIKQGTRTENGGILRNSPEWQAGEDLWRSAIASKLNWIQILGHTPRDLESY